MLSSGLLSPALEAGELAAEVSVGLGAAAGAAAGCPGPAAGPAPTAAWGKATGGRAGAGVDDKSGVCPVTASYRSAICDRGATPSILRMRNLLQRMGAWLQRSET